MLMIFLCYGATNVQQEGSKQIKAKHEGSCPIKAQRKRCEYATLQSRPIASTAAQSRSIASDIATTQSRIKARRKRSFPIKAKREWVRRIEDRWGAAVVIFGLKRQQGKTHLAFWQWEWRLAPWQPRVMARAVAAKSAPGPCAISLSNWKVEEGGRVG